jgi:hypothetical protein
LTDEIHKDGRTSRRVRTAVPHSGAWASSSQDFARLATLLYGHSKRYSEQHDGNVSIYALAGIPVLFSALHALLIELSSGIYSDLALDLDALGTLAITANDVTFIVDNYTVPRELREDLEMLAEVRHEIVHPSHRPGPERHNTPAYLVRLRDQALLQSTGNEIDYVWISQLQSHKLFRWAFTTVADTVGLLLEAHGAAAWAMGLVATYRDFEVNSA